MTKRHENFLPGEDMRRFQAEIHRPSKATQLRTVKAHSIEDFAQRILTQSATRNIEKRSAKVDELLSWDVTWREVVRPTTALQKKGEWFPAYAFVTDITEVN